MYVVICITHTLPLFSVARHTWPRAQISACTDSASAPVLRPVPDTQDFYNFFSVTVHNDVGRADKFAGSLHLSRSANSGEGSQLLNAVDDRLCDIPGSGRIVLLDVVNSGFKLVWRPPVSSE